MGNLSSSIFSDIKESEYRNRASRTIEQAKAEMGNGTIWTREGGCHCAICMIMAVAAGVVRLTLMDWAEGECNEENASKIALQMPDSIVGAYARRLIKIDGIDYTGLPFTREDVLQEFEKRDKERGDGEYDELESITVEAAIAIKQNTRRGGGSGKNIIGEILKAVFEEENRGF